ncbi:hypothetical protein [Micrococcus sp. IITD107]|uniref:hypothetical protein n=1 Tax=Micrococcus sp. IITD107 TaxID=3342790 RepID=UPI0035B9C337
MSAQLFLIDRPTWVNPAPLLAANREQEWSFKLLNQNDALVDDLDGVTDCSLTFNVNAEVRGGGSLTYLGPEIDWHRHRIQPWITVRASGQEQSWPLGVFIPSRPRDQYGDAQEPVTLDLYDKSKILGEIEADTGYSLPAGAVVTDRVRDVLTRNRIRPLAVTDSPATARTGRGWEWGTAIKTVVNEMLETINYFSLYVDPYGVYRADPYTRPQDRSPAWHFRDDAQGIYSPGFTRERDEHGVPNRVVLVSAVEADVRPLIARAQITDPKHPMYWANIGQIRSYRRDNVATTDQTTLDAMATRILEEKQRVNSTYQIEHLPIPININDAVHFTRAARSIDALTTVQSMELSMDSALCRTTLREVIAA